MTPEEERRCQMIVAELKVRLVDLVLVHVQGAALRCPDCHGATTQEVCPGCELKRERKLLADQIKGDRA